MEQVLTLTPTEINEWYPAAVSLLANEGYDDDYLFILNTAYENDPTQDNLRKLSSALIDVMKSLNIEYYVEWKACKLNPEAFDPIDQQQEEEEEDWWKPEKLKQKLIQIEARRQHDMMMMELENEEDW